MSQIIVLASGKGGTGKTTVTVNLAVALCNKGKKVLLIDCDCGMRGLDLMLGLDKNLVYDTSDVIAGNCFTEDAIYKYEPVDGLYLLPAPIDTDDEISPQVMKQFTDTIKNSYDYSLIDSPAGIGSGFITAITPADRAIIVTNPEPTSVRGAVKVRQALLKHNVDNIRLVINRLNVKNFKELGVYQDLDEVVDKSETQLIGVVPDDYRLVSFSQTGKPNLNNSISKEVFDRIADRLTGENLQLAFPKKF